MFKPEEEFSSGVRYESLISSSKQLLRAESLTQFRKRMEGTFHKAVVAYKQDKQITPGLHYALGLVQSLIIKKLLRKEDLEKADPRIIADEQLLAMIFGFHEYSSEDILKLYKKINEKNPSAKLNSLINNYEAIIILSQSIIDKVIAKFRLDLQSLF